ncbi:MAG: FAD-binding oxidoreductase [Ginsengibacter sp.]
MYDCIVIGKGLIGCAAAKYLAEAGQKVVLIGPGEPADLQQGVVFASHYDQARIQRIIGKDVTWTLLNKESVEVYPSLQKESGVNFHSPVGCLYVNPHGKDLYLDHVNDLSEKFQTEYKFFENGKSLNKAFPEFNFPESSMAILEDNPSGYINPRLLVEAQINLFKKNKGILIDEVAEQLIHRAGSIEVITNEGNTFIAKRILIAAGSFTNSFNLLDKKLSFKLKSESTIWARVSEHEAMRLVKLPSLLYEIDTPEIQNIYLIQPVQYPNGKFYCKMGANIPQDMYFDRLEEMQQWFRVADNSNNLEVLKTALQNLIPELEAQEFATKKCIITRTVHEKPYVGALEKKGLFVAAGGNGYGAMCSDALGRIAAHLVVHESFAPGYDEKDFLPIFESNVNSYPKTEFFL